MTRDPATTAWTEATHDAQTLKETPMTGPRTPGTRYENGTEAAKHVQPGDLVETYSLGAEATCVALVTRPGGDARLRIRFPHDTYEVLQSDERPVTLVALAPEPRIVWPTTPGSTARTYNWLGEGETRIAAVDEAGDWYVLGYTAPYATAELEEQGFKPVHDAGADQ